MSYQGWTNQDTWKTKLLMDNDKASYLYWRRRAKQAISVHDLAQGLSSPLNRHMHAGAASDGVDFDRVNWEEIAESILEDLREAS